MGAVEDPIVGAKGSPQDWRLAQGLGRDGGWLEVTGREVDPPTPCTSMEGLRMSFG